MITMGMLIGLLGPRRVMRIHKAVMYKSTWNPDKDMKFPHVCCVRRGEMAHRREMWTPLMPAQRLRQRGLGPYEKYHTDVKESSTCNKNFNMCACMHEFVLPQDPGGFNFPQQEHPSGRRCQALLIMKGERNRGYRRCRSKIIGPH